MVSPKDLGVLFWDLRKKKGLNQTELGSKVGLDQKKVSLLENGNPNIRVDSLSRLLSALEVGTVLVPKMVHDDPGDEGW